MPTYNSDKWDDWMQRAQLGDKAAYLALLQSLRPWLCAYFGKRIHDGTVEDRVQDTLMLVHQKRHTLEPGRPLLPWLVAVARHHWVDHLRKTAGVTTLPLEDWADSLLQPDSAEAEAAKHDVETLLDQISPAQAEVIKLVKIRDMSIEDTAQITGHSVASVKVMIHRGLKKLADRVQGKTDD